MSYYRIAGLPVVMTPHYEPLLSRSVPYLAPETEPPVSCVDLDPERLRFLQNKYPYASPDLLEYTGTGTRFYTLLLHFGGMMLHSSAVEMDGYAYLFSAPSGTGKSTHTALWLREFGDRASILNDDKPALRATKEGVFAYGTPWSGKTDLSVNKKVPVRGIAFLSRSETNRIRRMTSAEAIPLFLEQTARPADPGTYDLLFTVLERILKQVPVYALECNMEPEAARLSYQTMKEGTLHEDQRWIRP